jgi:aconitate hydratase
MTAVGQDTLKTRSTLNVDGKHYAYYSLAKASEQLGDISRLPYSMKVLLENLLRNEDGRSVKKEDIVAFSKWLKKRKLEHEISFRPARVLMQDFTGVPAVVDLAAMRNAMQALKGDPKKINPLVPVDLVIDHSVIVNFFGDNKAFGKNVAEEYKQNKERYEFLKWGQSAFSNFSVVPPGTGICHQVNLEYLAQTVWTKKQKMTVGKKTGTFEVAYPDTLVGTDSHTTMVNGLAVLGWGVGGIEAEAAMLGQPQSMLLPDVVGFKLSGALKEGVTATDLVLTVTQMLRKQGVVGKFVEFYGPGLDAMSVADKATIANMAPEYGATCGFFPVDAATIDYLKTSGRKSARVALVAAYAKAQGLYRTAKSPDPVFTETLKLDLGDVVPSMAGPKRPEGRVALPAIAEGFSAALTTEYKKGDNHNARFPVEGKNFDVGHGDVVIAAITSCTNTSNPSVLIAAGLLARNAVAKGLKTKPWVKTSLAPGSQVVAEYLANSGLQLDLDKIGFNLVGFGCTTCIGNSGPLPPEISKSINDNGIVAAAVLSGNRNFEGRVSPDVQANYLASPPLVVAHALAGTVTKNLAIEPIGEGKDGKPVFLKDIWPTTKDINAFIKKYVTSTIFKKKYANVFDGDANWRKIKTVESETYKWNMGSTYVQNPPYFEGMKKEPEPTTDIIDARILALFGDKITTDHISPAGSIKLTSPAGQVSVGAPGAPGRLQPVRHAPRQPRSDDARHLCQYPHQELHDAGCRRQRPEGGMTKHWPDGEAMSIYDAAMKYRPRTSAAGRVRRRRIRQRLVARLGCEGHPSARRSRRDYRKLRTYSSIQSGRHGHSAAASRMPGKAGPSMTPTRSPR